MRTLRGRLILSHILPLLLTVPLVGVTLLYLLQTQSLLTTLSEDLARQGAMTAELARYEPVIWQDSGEALRFVTLYSVRSRSHVMLFDAAGNLLASSEPSQVGGGRKPLDLQNLAAALSGEQQIYVGYSPSLRADVVQVLVPVIGANQKILGVIRLSQNLSGLQSRFPRLRSVILLALGAELLLGTGIGLILALSLGRSLQQVSTAVSGVAGGQEWRTLPERDPEEVRMLLRAFNTLVERLRLLDESRSRLLGNLVLELGRPIGALQSGVQALLNGSDQEPGLRRELLRGMDEQVHALRPLLDSLTELHGQVLGELEMNLAPMSLHEWLPRILAPWREAAQENGLEWCVDLSHPLPLVETDPDRLGQALGNLLNNAIKYTAEGSVSVQVHPADSGVVISVSDTGLGITASERKRLFEPFYRGARNQPLPQGLGLGLSTAHDLITALGGRLEVESILARGSRFTIWLPPATTGQPTSK